MTEYAALITFPDRAVTYEAYSNLNTEGPQVGLVADALIERNEQGQLSIAEANSDAAAGGGVLTGSLVGMLVGALAGPIGLLLGGSLGAATGALATDDDLETSEDVLAEFGRAVPPGGNAIVAQTVEDDPAPLDALVAKYRGTVARRELAEVLDELEAQQAAAEAAAEVARQKLKEQRRAEKKAKNEERLEDLKKKLHL